MVGESWRPSCWSCGASGHIAKECPAKCTQPPPHPTITTVTAAAVVVAPAEEGVSAKPPNGTWKEVKKTQKMTNVPSPQKQQRPKQQSPLQEQPEKQKQLHKEV